MTMKILTIDFETYYDREYSLSKLTTEEYVRDDRFERPDGSESYVLMKNGDAAVYKGCEREHWRDPLESKYGKWENKWRTFRKKEDDTYHHQIFLHYVNSQGPFVHHANDR